jgi:AmiR/NasT family two-component response regulator
MNVSEIPNRLRRAARYLAAQYHCSVSEASEWIHQEARAKKASLGEVAEAFLSGRTVTYHHDAPV